MLNFRQYFAPWFFISNFTDLFLNFFFLFFFHDFFLLFVFFWFLGYWICFFFWLFHHSLLVLLRLFKFNLFFRFLFLISQFLTLVLFSLLISTHIKNRLSLKKWRYYFFTLLFPFHLLIFFLHKTKTTGLRWIILLVSKNSNRCGLLIFVIKHSLPWKDTLAILFVRRDTEKS